MSKEVVILPEQVGQLRLPSGKVASVAELNAVFRHVHVQLPVDSADYRKLFDFVVECAGVRGGNDGWFFSAPDKIIAAVDSSIVAGADEAAAGAIDSLIDYIGMLVAIDFRHWSDAEDLSRGGDGVGGSGLEDEVVRATGEPIDVKHFFAVVGGKERAAHAETAELVRGSAAMVLLCKRAVDEYELSWYTGRTAATLNTQPAACRKLFEGVAADGVTPQMMPAAAHRVKLIREVAAAVSFSSVLKDCKRRLFNGGSGFIERLVASHPRYDDSAEVDISPIAGEKASVKVYFLKLAQLTAVALHAALQSLALRHPDSAICQRYFELATFADAADLSVCSDYQLPRGLRAAGVIRYDEHLAAIVDTLRHVSPLSVEEVEIRLASTVGSRLLQADVLRHLASDPKAYGQHVCDVSTMDFALWKYGRSLGIHHPQPHHLSKTDKY